MICVLPLGVINDDDVGVKRIITRRITDGHHQTVKLSDSQTDSHRIRQSERTAMSDKQFYTAIIRHQTAHSLTSQ